MISIYCITNQVNGKKYVGYSVNLDRRWDEHKNRNDNRLLHADIKLHGHRNFTIEVVDQAETKADALRLEKLYIEKLDTLQPAGYNILKGDQGYKHSEEDKRRISEANKGRRNALGCKRTQEQLERYRQAAQRREAAKR